MLVGTVTLVSLRTILFLSCRKYLLHNLYSDLQHHDGAAAATPLSGTFVSTQNLSLTPGLPLPSTSPAIGGPNSRTVRGKDSLHSSISRTIFSICFSESCILFVLLMFQAMGIFSPSDRIWNWKFSLFLLLSLIVILIPLLMTLLLTIGAESNKSGASTRLPSLPRLSLALIIVVIYLYGLSYVPLPSAFQNLPYSDVITPLLVRLIVVGTLILGLLSGFGAVSNAWRVLPWGKEKRESVPSENELAVAESALERVEDDLRKKRDEMRRREENSAEESWYSRFVPNVRGDEHAQELQGLEALQYQMSRSVSEIRQARSDALFNATFKGRIWTFGMKIFAWYCVLRVFIAVINIVFPASNQPVKDNEERSSLTNLIVELLGHVASKATSSPKTDVDQTPSDYHAYDLTLVARQISLFLVGLIILSSIRVVLRGVTRFLRLTSGRSRAELGLLVLAQLMGTYLLSTIVQLRTSFPPSNDSGNENQNLFSTIPEFEVFGPLFNFAFLGGAFIAGIVRFVIGSLI